MLFLQGDGDSEIALVVEDSDMINTTMDGEPYQVARFAATLRRQLFQGWLIYIWQNMNWNDDVYI